MRIFVILLSFFFVFGCVDFTSRQNISKGVARFRSKVFFKGADVSWLPQMEQSGFVFYNFSGSKMDLLDILKENGMNTIRLRTWVNPSNDPINGHCSVDETVDMAVRVKKKGLYLMINFHYSDSWADPSKQYKPKNWQDLTFDQLKTKVYEYTKDVMIKLASRGIYPEFVQIGNEINSGMLWPDGSYTNFSNLAELIKFGVRAVREVSPKTLVVIHLAKGHDVELFKWFFGNLNRYFTDYDVIGMSYYPYWAGDWRKTLPMLISNMNEMVRLYRKYVMVVETGHFYYREDETYDILVSLINGVRSVIGKKGIGVLYWEPQGAEIWSGYSMSIWKNDGKPTKALKAFRD
ncbi:MAG: arabinogalactan endo-1,4-beta-galactosidase [Brevinematales bacterium]|nr:arabinogalactan endo-1,4-beta-galactosidase [Brevinematales bacterium]